ncbi:ABC transporter permease [Anaeromicropila populeti]|uniref:ABC-type transport system, involved in lipoprotein release, permease component n=1 Tax=Anaeromicropila populeti TaxID=37658 RepID=A0A1I6HL95_9FIRM|nr:ABC transporter permease [Anaeromicropila populeti]SFR55206.1 ABC-type transport system, involved in lipoprotein release, permease component [Anaeromicropila populeti]
MRISDLVKMGLKNLSRRKARTALTVIGVIIGTISIVVMISIGLGMNQSFNKFVMELGSLTMVTIEQNTWVQDDDDEYSGKVVVQKLDDNLVETLKQVKHVKAVSPIWQAQAELQTSGKAENNVQIIAVDFDYLDDLGLADVSYGTMPTADEKNKIIIGGRVMEQFYKPSNWNYTPIEVDPAKEKIFMTFQNWEYSTEKEMKKQLLKDFCVLEATASYTNYDWSIIVDVSYYKELYTKWSKNLKLTDQKSAMKKLKEYSSIQVIVDNVKNVKDVQKKIDELGVKSTSLSSTLEPMKETSNMLQMVLGGVGAVAMIVSAISIANTMIMSIYERTKEIGVMKVLGCVITDIKKLFLFEAGSIGAIGGIIGVLISYFLSYLINRFGGPVFAGLMSGSGMLGGEDATYSLIPFWLPVLAVAFAFFVGVFSGYYPARRATKISAIEAMKSEG